jgi:hypothetical protein
MGLAATGVSIGIRLVWKKYEPVQKAASGELAFGNDYPPDSEIVYRLSFDEGGKTAVYVGQRKVKILNRLKEHLREGSKDFPAQRRFWRALNEGIAIDVEVLTSESTMKLGDEDVQIDLKSVFQRCLFENAAIVEASKIPGVEVLNVTQPSPRKEADQIN